MDEKDKRILLLEQRVAELVEQVRYLDRGECPDCHEMQLELSEMAREMNSARDCLGGY